MVPGQSLFDSLLDRLLNFFLLISIEAIGVISNVTVLEGVD
jgi:hypothetical protein